MRRMMTVGAGTATLLLALACGGDATLTDAMVPPADEVVPAEPVPAPAPADPATDAPADPVVPEEGKAGKGGKTGKKAH